MVQIVLADAHVLILRNIIPLDQFIIIDIALAHRAKMLLLDTTPAGRMQLIEVDILLIESLFARDPFRVCQ